MNNVIRFPAHPRTRYDPRGLAVLNGLEPVRGECITFLGQCDAPSEVIQQLDLILRGHKGIHAIRVLDSAGQEVVLFRGELPAYINL